MSYSILYDSQFIKSREGITPCTLVGDNNVYETSRKRARDWSCFLNLAGVPADEVLEKAESLAATGYDEYYRRGGKSMDGPGLLRWVRGGIKNAAYLEDILEANNRTSVHCYVTVWRGNRSSHEMDEWLSTTLDFDSWLAEFKVFREQFDKTKHPGDCVFPVVTFWENMAHPKPMKAVPSVIKGRNGYFCGIETRSTGGYSTRWSTKAENAMIIQPDGIGTYIEKVRAAGSKKIRVLDAKVVERAKSAVSVIFARNTKTGESGFVVQVTSRRMRYNNNIERAHRYSTDASAAAAIDRLSKKFPSWMFEVRLAS